MVDGPAEAEVSEEGNKLITLVVAWTVRHVTGRRASLARRSIPMVSASFEYMRTLQARMTCILQRYLVAFVWPCSQWKWKTKGFLRRWRLMERWLMSESQVSRHVYIIGRLGDGCLSRVVLVWLMSGCRSRNPSCRVVLVESLYTHNRRGARLSPS